PRRGRRRQSIQTGCGRARYRPAADERLRRRPRDPRPPRSWRHLDHRGNRIRSGGRPAEEPRGRLRLPPGETDRPERSPRQACHRPRVVGTSLTGAARYLLISAAGQLRTTLMGCAASSMVLTRKRWPSGDTSYMYRPLRLTWGSNNVRTAPTSTAAPRRTNDADIN